MTKLEMIQEARQSISRIARATKNCPSGHYTAIYESENGVTVSHIQNGWNTNTATISFGDAPLTKKQVKDWIDQVEDFETQVW